MHCLPDCCHKLLQARKKLLLQQIIQWVRARKPCEASCRHWHASKELESPSRAASWLLGDIPNVTSTPCPVFFPPPARGEILISATRCPGIYLWNVVGVTVVSSKTGYGADLFRKWLTVENYSSPWVWQPLCNHEKQVLWLVSHNLCKPYGFYFCMLFQFPFCPLQTQKIQFQIISPNSGTFTVRGSGFSFKLPDDRYSYKLLAELNNTLRKPIYNWVERPKISSHFNITQIINCSDVPSLFNDM